MNWGTPVREGVAGVKSVVVEVKRSLATETIGTGPSQDLDTTKAEAIVFSGKRICVDTDLANGRARWQATAGKSVHKDLSAVWTSRWTSQCLECCGEIVRIVRQRIDVIAF